jgi:hypothetical protein
MKKKSDAPLPSSLSDVSRRFLQMHGARFDAAARADEATLRATLDALKIKPWPVLFEIERDFGGLRFAEESEAWLLGPYAIAKSTPEWVTETINGAPLVCVGRNDTGGLFADKSGLIWDEDAAEGAIVLRADSMKRRLEKEAYSRNIHELRQRKYKILPREADAAGGARRLDLPLVTFASDEIGSMWQNEDLTVSKSANDVRVFAKTDAALERALAVLGFAR